VDSVIALDGRGGAREFVCGYADYRATESGEAEASLGATPSEAAKRRKASPGTEPQGKPRAKKGLSYAERKELEGLLDEISALEGEKAALEALFSSHTPNVDDIEKSNRRYAELGPLIEARTARWESLASREHE
jgi:ABC transport system ATP-binding/permease protein